MDRGSDRLILATTVVGDLVEKLHEGFDELHGDFITSLSTNVLKKHARSFVVHAMVRSGGVTCAFETGTVVVSCSSVLEQHRRGAGSWRIAEHFKQCVVDYVRGVDARVIFHPLMTDRVLFSSHDGTSDADVVGVVKNRANMHSPTDLTIQHAESFLLHAMYASSNQVLGKLRVIEARTHNVHRYPVRQLRQAEDDSEYVRGVVSYGQTVGCPAATISDREAIKEFMRGNGDIVSLVKESLVNPVTFQDHRFVCVDPGLDFGIHTLCDRTSRTMDGSYSLLEMQERVHLASGTVLRKGTVRITLPKHSDARMWLCGGVAFPRFDGRFLMCDQCNLFLHEYAKPHLLKDGVSYPISVIMSTEDSNTDTGILKQDCVMLFCCPYSQRQLLNNSHVSYRDYRINGKQYRMFCLGFKVAAVVLKKRDFDVYDAPLNIKAKPFYSKAMRDIFDSRPSYLSSSFEDYVLEDLMVDRSLLHLCSYDALAQDRVRYFDIPLDEPLVTKFAKLIQVEAMQHMIDIKGHDMYFCRISMAVFDDCKPRTYHIIGEDAPKVYRGYLSKRKGINRALVVIKVPSIIEGHPAVYLGTVVHLRRVKYSETEYNLICCGIDRETLFLLPPQEMIQNTSLFDTFLRLHSDCQGTENLWSVRFGCSTASLRSLLSPLTDADLIKYVPDAANDEHSKSMCLLSIPYLSKEVEEVSFKIQARSILNKEQSFAIAVLLLGGGRDSPVTILGPPGTGKTATLTQSVIEILEMYPESRILCCAPVNFSCDVIMSELKRKGVSSNCMLRLNDPRRPVFSVKNDILDCCVIEESSGIFKIPSPQEIGKFRIVICTCAASEFLPRQLFSHVLIDEAGQAIVPETLLPFRALKDSKEASDISWGTCLCGDPKQLGPVVRNSIASLCGLGISLLEILEGTVPSHNCSLRQNYRCNEEILRLPSNLFYSSKLVYSGDNECVLPPHMEWEENSSAQQRPLIFYGVNGEHTRAGESHSYSNKMEAVICASLIQNLVSRGEILPDDIGVLALYRRQVYLIRAILREHGLTKVRVGTLDDYQGQEEKVVFVSTVISDMNDLGPSAKEFFQNPNRFNVAITRAKRLLVVLGHPAVISLDSIWKEYLREAIKVGGLFGSYNDFLDIEINVEDRSSEVYSIVSAFRNLAILGSGMLGDAEDDLALFDEDIPWRILL